MDDKTRGELLAKIRTAEGHIEVTKQRISDAKEMQNDYVENTSEWLEWREAQEAMQRAKAKLDARLANDGDYNNFAENLGQLRDQLKSEKQTLSDLVVGYAMETKRHQIEYEDSGKARDIIITGKLSSKVKRYQTNMFVDGSDNG